MLLLLLLLVLLLFFFVEFAKSQRQRPSKKKCGKNRRQHVGREHGAPIELVGMIREQRFAKTIFPNASRGSTPHDAQISLEHSFEVNFVV